VKKLSLYAAVLLAAALTFAMIKRVATRTAEKDHPGAEVLRVERRDIGSVVKAPGIVMPMVGAEVRVGSSASGVVSRLFVRIGDRVDKGKLLAELDSRGLVARRDAAEAAVGLARANLSYSLTDLRRKQQLNSAQVISRSELELAQQSYDVSEQQYKQAVANLADARTQLEYTKIFAPVAGTVESVSTQEGETVASSFSTPTFVTLLDLARLEVWAYVDETDIGRLHVGEKASFTVDTYGDEEFSGKVTSIYPQAQIRDNIVDYVVVVHFQAPRDRFLRPQMTTTVKIAIDQRQNVLVLPTRAIHRDGKRRFVMLRNANQVEKRWITTGMRDDSYWEITGGLQENDEVLVEGIEKP